MENVFARSAVFTIAILLCSMLIIGCTQNQAPSKSQPGDNGTVAAANKINTSIADNKTAYDKNQTTIAKVIADGTYTGDETYQYHSGTETVTFSVTVKDDTITGATVEAHNPNPISGKIIGNFAAALPDLVVGKKINELNIPRNVAGSSLTTAAFKQYVGGLVTNPPAQG